jgi:hypothetical protein
MKEYGHDLEIKLNNMDKEIELIYPTEIIAGCISIYRNIWEDPEKTINDMETFSNNNPEDGFSRATLTGKRVNSKRTNSDMSLSIAANQNDTMLDIYKRYYDLVFATGVGYNKHYNFYEPTFINEGFNVLKYQTGEEYKAHYDGGSASARSISPILYLNDDYEGGEIEFVNFNVTIKPEKGMLVLFPGTYPYAHIAHPVTSGTKYAIVTWLHDRPLDNLSRSALGI